MFNPTTHTTARAEHELMKNSVAPVSEYPFQPNAPRRKSRLMPLIHLFMALFARIFGRIIAVPQSPVIMQHPTEECAVVNGQ